MKKKLLSLGLCAVVAVSAVAETEMVASYKLGDSMGASGVTAKVINLYDSENKVIRTHTIVTGYDGVSLTETIQYYNYNENNLLVEDYAKQYLLAYNRWDEKEHNYYQYDSNDRIIRQQQDSTRAYKYYYDNDGNLEKEEYLTTRAATILEDSIIYEINFFDFDENGNPARSEGDGEKSDYRYDATFTYDDLGRCTEIMRMCIQGTKHSKETYSYDDLGVLADKYTYISAYGAGGRESGEVGGVKDTLRYQYHHDREALGNGWYHYVTYSWYNSGAMWTNPATSYNELYVALDGAYAPLNAVAENISTAEQPQTVKITCDVPATLPCENTSYIIWRSGEWLDVVTATDGKIEYIDTEVPTGNYEYIVQAYDATNDVYYNCSDIATVDVTIPLNPATNIRVVGGYWGIYEDAQTPAHESFYVKLAWDVAESENTILGYKVWLYPWAYAMYEIEGDKRYCEVPMTDAEAGNFRIDVVYEFGVEEGEYVPLFWDNSADFEGEPKVKLYITHEENYGDHMGGHGASSINYYIYDVNNNLSRTVQYGYNTDGTTSPMYNYFYEYNAAGQLISQFYRQLNSLGEWTSNKQTYVYEYENGLLISKEDTTAFTLYEYSYDADGNLVEILEKKRSRGQTTYDKLNSTTTYSNFDENGNPANSSYIHAVYASSSYYTTYTYDAQGRTLVAESRTEEGLAYDKYEYEYDEYGIEISKTYSRPKYDDTTYQPTEDFLYSTRTIRADMGNATYKRYDETYNAKDDTWKANGRYTVESYSALNGGLAPQNLVVEDASTAESPNTILVEANFPEVRLADAQYIIWRGWIPVDTVTATAHQGIIRFYDTDVVNGTYEYIVQTYDAATGKAFNATAPVKMTLEARLETVQNLRFVRQEEGEFRDPDMGKLPVYWIHFEWDAPNTTLPIAGYNIYQDGYVIPMNTTTNTNDSVWVYRMEDGDKGTQQTSTTVEVRVQYAIGESEGVMEVFEVSTSALDNVTLEGTAYVAGKTLFTEPDAQVTLYNLSGVVIATYNNKHSIDLSHLPTGVYVAIVKVGEAGQLLKVAL